MWPQFPGKVRILCIVRWQWHSYSQIYGDKVLWFIRPGLDTLININMPRNLHVLIADWLFRITPIFLDFFLLLSCVILYLVCNFTVYSVINFLYSIESLCESLSWSIYSTGFYTPRNGCFENFDQTSEVFQEFVDDG